MADTSKGPKKVLWDNPWELEVVVASYIRPEEQYVVNRLHVETFLNFCEGGQEDVETSDTQQRKVPNKFGKGHGQQLIGTGGQSEMWLNSQGRWLAERKRTW
eukprot:CAMPEP_0206613842 /NCGR_PEP_ID=MMETSP0325_2-20121206/56977_1 /ASSEMBLY_ACC=CAM_ASM_000347 /TAXON_ID=2866 /ORGANISM="Crypthecodinium cohnii, Strain Seligo" /LENGTH=101 /DNA_ID=CAMNT_0054134105 /DNA_START=257 /DNA_END=559 /DNA_ORIENTATION=-